MADGNEIDLVKYGVLWQKVQDMDRKVDKMERQLEELLALAARMSISFCLSFGDSMVHNSEPMSGGLLDPFLALTGLPVDSL